MIADVAVGIICRDGEKSLGTLLDSLRPYVAQIVVGIDALTKDATEQVARDHGADLTPTIAVSHEHTCEYHGTILAQHFANARNQVFAHLDKQRRWLAWIDADDILHGGEHLAEYLSALPAEVNCVWLPYHYATMLGGRVSSTVFDRERLLRSDLTWEWKNRVHEVVATTVPINAARTERIYVAHQEGVHKSINSVERNHVLLEIDLEENPEDKRALYYLGNGFIAAGNFRAAIDTYKRLIELGPSNQYDGWSALCYMGIAHLRLGEPAEAKVALNLAMDENPFHPEPYLYMARACNAQGRWREALKWIDLARHTEKPPSFVFTNPLDYSFNACVDEAEAYAALGEVSKARQCLERAVQIIPDNEGVNRNLAQYRSFEDTARKASAIVTLFNGRTDDEIVAMAQTIPMDRDLKAFGRVHDIVTPAYLRLRRGLTPRMAFFCGGALEPWAPPILNTTGIGGSETAVVEMARRFAADGWRVDVFGTPGEWEGEHEGSGWWHYRFYDPAADARDVTVFWRTPDAPLPDRTAAMLWLHDYSYPGKDLSRWPTVLGVSAYHARVLGALNRVPEAQLDYVPNGINLDRFTPLVKREPASCVYSSSPDRGLEVLLDIWPQVLRAEPGATLTVAYGWQNIDKMIRGGNEYLAGLKARITPKLRQTGVKFVGRLPQTELADLFSRSMLWTYPTTFLETSCISAMEAMAGGCVPITTNAGALEETVGVGGVVVGGPDGMRAMPHSAPWREFYAAVVVGYMRDRALRIETSVKAVHRARDLTWDASYERWKGIVERRLAG